MNHRIILLYGHHVCSKSSFFLLLSIINKIKNKIISISLVIQINERYIKKKIIFPEKIIRK